MDVSFVLATVHHKKIASNRAVSVAFKVYKYLSGGRSMTINGVKEYQCKTHMSAWSLLGKTEMTSLSPPW